MSVRELSVIAGVPAAAAGALRALWRPVIGHTHHLRSGQVPAEQAGSNLLAWCRAHGVGALGLGSPWEPVSKEKFARYEGPDRAVYDAGRIAPEAVMDRAEIRACLAGLNRDAGGATFFYLDNETPKCRYGHLWYFGWDYDVPAWHDYDQDRPVQWHDGDDHAEINPLTGTPFRRRPYVDVVARQRRAGALAVWAHPTSWWTQPIPDHVGARHPRTAALPGAAAMADERFITNIAAEAGLHLIADGFLDGLAVMGYDACHRGYQDLWFHLLDTGALVPGFAETDGCFDRPSLAGQEQALASVMPVGEHPTPAAIAAAARFGRACASSGPFLHLSVDGVDMGGTVASAAGQEHRLRLIALPAPGEDGFARVDVVGRGGRVRWSRDRVAGGVIELAIPGDDQPGWLLARATGAGADPDGAQKAIRSYAITNPVYLHPPGWRFAAQRTAYRLEVGADSPWRGGSVRFQHADGTTIAEHLADGSIALDLPASASVRLAKDGRSRTFAIAAENPRAQTLLRYLWAGEFRRDFPAVRPGQVPPAVWRLADLRDCLRSASYAV